MYPSNTISVHDTADRLSVSCEVIDHLVQRGELELDLVVDSPDLFEVTVASLESYENRKATRPDTEAPLATIGVAARLTGLDEATIHRGIESGQFTSVDVDGKPHIRLHHLDGRSDIAVP